MANPFETSYLLFKRKTVTLYPTEIPGSIFIDCQSIAN